MLVRDRNLHFPKLYARVYSRYKHNILIQRVRTVDIHMETFRRRTEESNYRTRTYLRLMFLISKADLIISVFSVCHPSDFSGV